MHAELQAIVELDVNWSAATSSESHEDSDELSNALTEDCEDRSAKDTSIVSSVAHGEASGLIHLFHCSVAVREAPVTRIPKRRSHYSCIGCRVAR